MNQIEKTDTYIQTFKVIKQKIQTAQIKAAMSVNSEMIILYWEIGKTILERQETEGWGANVINRLSRDLKETFPDMKGFSPRNLGYMKKFASIYTDFSILQQLAAKLPWWHNVILIDKIETSEERLWYAQQAIKNGWSRNVMVLQIESQLYDRQVLANKTTNFELTLPKPQSDLAQQLIKDPYTFDFLTIVDDYKEKEIEQELVKHITHFLLELGTGFAFVGQQYKVEVSNKDFYIDLLFYHTKLKCYVVIELKASEFRPEHAGKINFYLSAVDDLVKEPDDNPSIGIILCKLKDKVMAEYALRDLKKPVGVSEYQILKSIPDEIKTSLPTIEEIEKELSKGLSDNNTEKDSGTI
ncbi:MAG: PDDEXK nuclease domain-containing protein [Cyanobacteriota bacterium]